MYPNKNIAEAIAAILPVGAAVSDESRELHCNAYLLSLLKEHRISRNAFLEKMLFQANDNKEPYEISFRDAVFYVYYKKDSLSGHEIHTFIIQDRTEYHEKLDELQIYKTLMESTNDQGFMVCDANHKVLIYNKPAAAAPDDDTIAESVIGNRYEDVFPHPETSNMLKVLKTGVPIINEKNVYLTPSGKTITAFGSSYPIKTREGKIIASASVIRWSNNIVPLLKDILEFQNQFLCQGKMNNNTRYTFSSIIGNSDIMRAAIQKAKKAASFTLMPILIYGETGTGKELFAQSIHNASANKSHPFIAVNCAAIPETLLEITLFGSVRGAFTDAVNTTGLFEQAGSGTIFLDEINSMPMSIQPKILRVIQEKSFRKLGSSSEIAVNCRIIASMNKPPLDCIANNTLREDLFYRLSAITIEVPPLRERKEDIETLANYFIQKYSATYEVAPIVMPPKYLEMLRRHSWPGNVRELQNTIESSLVMLEPSSGSFPAPDIFTHYDAEISGGSSKADNLPPPEESEVANLKDALFSTEKQMLVTALNKYSWNISNAAKALGISRSNLQYKIEKFGLARK